MGARATNWIAIALLAFSAFSIQALLPPPDPDYDLLALAEAAARNDAKGDKPTADAVNKYYKGFIAERRSVWLETLLFFGASVFAALIAFWRRKVGSWLVLLVCAYLLIVSGPPFIRMAIDGGLLNFVSLVFKTTIGQHGVPRGLLISWHIVIAPFAYALLAVAAMYSLRQLYRRPQPWN